MLSKLINQSSLDDERTKRNETKKQNNIEKKVEKEMRGEEKQFEIGVS